MKTKTLLQLDNGKLPLDEHYVNLMNQVAVMEEHVSDKLCAVIIE